MEEPKMLPDLDASSSPALAVRAPSFDDPVLDELARRMLSWGRVWFGPAEGSETTAEQYRVRARLLYWVKRCVGGKATDVLTTQNEDVSLAASAPLLTALLGRLAMLELSRRVLDDAEACRMPRAFLWIWRMC